MEPIAIAVLSPYFQPNVLQQRFSHIILGKLQLKMMDEKGVAQATLSSFAVAVASLAFCTHQ
jgi:hypothetical protein